MAILVNTQIRDNLYITGSTQSGRGFTGSFFGTGSWTMLSKTSSFSLELTSASFAISSSQAVTASFAPSASWTRVMSGSFQLAQTVMTRSFTGRVLLDFEGTNTNILTTTGSVNFTSSNVAPGRSLSVKFLASESAITLNFPAGWLWLGPDMPPSSLFTGKTGILALTSFSSSNNFIVATWAFQV